MAVSILLPPLSITYSMYVRINLGGWLLCFPRPVVISFLTLVIAVTRWCTLSSFF